MTTYNDQISVYVTELFASQDQVLEQIRDAIPRKGLPAIAIQPEEGRFLQVMVHACDARKAVEIGTLGGYSGIWIASSLGPGGKLITLEKDPYHAAVAREHFAAAGLLDRVEIRLGDAHQSLQKLTTESPFDFVFIDADKASYPTYLDWALANTRLGGVIAAHNAFWHGEITQPRPSSQDTHIMREFNRRIASDPRLVSTIFPAGDGTLVAVKIA